MAIDFENQQLKIENSDLKKTNLSLSAISHETKNTSSIGTMTEQHGLPMITLPIIEKKKDPKFDLGEESNRVATNPALRQKICRLRLKISRISQAITRSIQASNSSHFETRASNHERQTPPRFIDVKIS